MAITVRAIQKQHEMAWFINTLLRNKVSSLLSIGLYEGGMELNIARMYRAKDRSIEITGIDIDDRPELQESIREIRETWNQPFTFLRRSSHDSQDDLGKFDAVWIDGDHSYKSVKQDFELALTKATKIIAFHDIVDCDYHRKMGCFVSRLWKEIKISGLRTEEIVGNDWAGIGIIYL